MRWTEERVFALVLLAVTALAEAQALSFKPIARFVPLVIGTPALLLALALCVKAWTKPVVRPAGQGKPKATKELRNWAWVMGLILLIYLFGFLVAMLAFIFLFLKLESCESWRLSVGLTLAVGAGIYVIFFWFLQLRLYPGALATLWL